MKIRYYHINNPGLRRTTRDFDPNGTPSRYFTLTLRDGEETPTGAALYAELSKPLYPDVPFKVALPKVLPVKRGWDWQQVEEPQPDGTVIIKKIWTMYWIVSPEERALALGLFEDTLRKHLAFVQRFDLPDIPDGDGWRWELVDMTKPPRERYTPIPVEVGRYRGPEWRRVEVDLFEYYTDTFSKMSEPVKAMCKRIVKL